MNAIEKKYVYDTYSKIAHSFSNTRSYIWPSVKLFLDNLDVGSIILEVGCGNGKNLDYRKDCFSIGLDDDGEHDISVYQCLTLLQTLNSLVHLQSISCFFSPGMNAGL